MSEKYATIELFDELCRVVADIDVADIDVDGPGEFYANYKPHLKIKLDTGCPTNLEFLKISLALVRQSTYTCMILETKITKFSLSWHFQNVVCHFCADIIFVQISIYKTKPKLLKFKQISSHLL